MSIPSAITRTEVPRWSVIGYPWTTTGTKMSPRDGPGVPRGTGGNFKSTSFEQGCREHESYRRLNRGTSTVVTNGEHGCPFTGNLKWIQGNSESTSLVLTMWSYTPRLRTPPWPVVRRSWVPTERWVTIGPGEVTLGRLEFRNCET